MPASVTFCVDGEPVPKGRPRLGRGGGTYTPARTREYEERVGWAYRQTAPGLVFEGPVRVWVYVHEGRRSPRLQGDADNYAKVLDGLNGIAWHDDRQVVELHVYLERGAGLPRLEVMIMAKEAA